MQIDYMIEKIGLEKFMDFLKGDDKSKFIYYVLDHVYEYEYEESVIFSLNHKDLCRKLKQDEFYKDKHVLGIETKIKEFINYGK